MATYTQAPGTASISSGSGSGNTDDWYNINNIKVSDDTGSVTSQSVGPSYSEYLKASNFGFSISSTETISGITVGIKRKSYSGDATNYVKDKIVSLIKADGTIDTTNKANTTDKWTTSYATVTYGSSSDVWGLTLTYADINDPDFGVALQISQWNNGGGMDQGDVDYIYMTVTTTSASSIKSYNGLAKASIKSYNGLASPKSINGLS